MTSTISRNYFREKRLYNDTLELRIKDVVGRYFQIFSTLMISKPILPIFSDPTL